MLVAGMAAGGCGEGDEEREDQRGVQSQVQPGQLILITQDAATGRPEKKCFAIEVLSNKKADLNQARADQAKAEVDRRCSYFNATKTKAICKEYSVCKGDTVLVLENFAAELADRGYLKVSYQAFSDCGEPFPGGEGWLYFRSQAMAVTSPGDPVTARKFGLFIPFVRNDDAKLQVSGEIATWRGIKQSSRGTPHSFIVLADNKVTITERVATYGCKPLRSGPSTSASTVKAQGKEVCLKPGREVEIADPQTDPGASSADREQHRVRVPKSGNCYYYVKLPEGSSEVRGWISQGEFTPSATEYWTAVGLQKERHVYHFAPPPPAITAPCLDNSHCPLDEIDHGQWCYKPTGQCAALGECRPLPWDCSPIPEGPTVIGCDGTCYADPCYAFIQGVNVQQVTSCQPPAVGP